MGTAAGAHAGREVVGAAAAAKPRGWRWQLGEVVGEKQKTNPSSDTMWETVTLE
jgi:hypothetical protein